VFAAPATVSARPSSRPVQDGSRRAITAAFLANSGIAVAKGIGFAITGATSMLAEAVHSVADAGNQGLLLLGGTACAEARVVYIEPDVAHPPRTGDD